MPQLFKFVQLVNNFVNKWATLKAKSKQSDFNFVQLLAYKYNGFLYLGDYQFKAIPSHPIIPSGIMQNKNITRESKRADNSFYDPIGGGHKKTLVNFLNRLQIRYNKLLDNSAYWCPPKIEIHFGWCWPLKFPPFAQQTPCSLLRKCFSWCTIALVAGRIGITFTTHLQSLVARGYKGFPKSFCFQDLFFPDISLG